MKIAILLLMITGLILGPAYWIYAKFYSGELAQSLQMTRDSQGAYVCPPFRLTEGMRPAGVILKAQGHFSPNMPEDQPPQNLYQARITLNGQTYREVDIKLGVKTVSDTQPAFVEHLLWLEAITPGEYQVSLIPRQETAIVMDRMDLEVRSHILEPDGRVVAAGGAMFSLGLLAWFSL